MVDNARAVCASIYKRAVQPASRSTHVVGRFTSLGSCILTCLDVVNTGSAKSELRCDGYDVCGEPCLVSGTNPLRCGPPLNVEMSARIFRCLRNARLRKQFNFPAVVPNASGCQDLYDLRPRSYKYRCLDDSDWTSQISSHRW